MVLLGINTMQAEMARVEESLQGSALQMRENAFSASHSLPGTTHLGSTCLRGSKWEEGKSGLGNRITV